MTLSGYSYSSLTSFHIFILTMTEHLIQSPSAVVKKLIMKILVIFPIFVITIGFVVLAF